MAPPLLYSSLWYDPRPSLDLTLASRSRIDSPSGATPSWRLLDESEEDAYYASVHSKARPTPASAPEASAHAATPSPSCVLAVRERARLHIHPPQHQRAFEQSQPEGS